MTRARGRRARLVGALIAATLLSACTSAMPRTPSPRPSASSPPTTSHAITAATSSAPASRSGSTAPSSTVASSPVAHRRHHHHSPPPVPTTPASTSSPPPPPPSSPPPPPPPPQPKSTCRNVAVRVIPGGATEGTEIAGLQFTNDGNQTCTLVGYPRVVLLKGGHRVGTPSQPAGPLPGRAVSVPPGHTVQSTLRDYSSCQAPLSKSARVTVPGESKRAVRRAELRACTLRVSQLGPPR